MRKLIKYYEENICPFCLNCNTENCKKNILTDKFNNIKSLICYEYLLNESVEKSQYDIKHTESTLPKKYYFKNYKEI